MNPRLLIAVLAVFILSGAGIFLATRDPAPPSHRVEKVLPRDQFLN